jgi:hypothetical protein
MPLEPPLTIEYLMDISQRLKQIAMNPSEMYMLQDMALLERHMPDVEHGGIRLGMKAFSRGNPGLALRCVLEPFVLSLGTFCKSEDVLGRWLTAGEVQQCARIKYASCLDTEFLEKRSQFYTLRKILSQNPEWAASMAGRRGALKASSRIDDFSELLASHTTYLLTEVFQGPIDEDELARFAKFLFQELQLSEQDIQRTFAQSLVRKFREGI